MIALYSAAVARRKRQSRRRFAAVDYACAIAALAVVAWLLLKLPLPAPSTGPLAGDEARAFNAGIPFVAGSVAPAKPFFFHGTVAAREQAVRCLATAALYEAGPDRDGQKAVIQVVLNRARSGRFAKTICGVVYQRSAPAAVCQFSFACDGSAVRRPQHDGWSEARGFARRALAGYVFAPVGSATHYHADYVVPGWIRSLDKIAQIRAHIFYRDRT